jgi:hypothetical protein
MKRFTTIVGVAIACLFLLLIGAGTLIVAFGAVSVSSSTNLRSGRMIQYQIDGWAGYSTQESIDTTTIKVRGNVIVVSPTQITVDGKVCATIDKNVKTVAIHARNDRITFDADGAPAACFQR